MPVGHGGHMSKHPPEVKLAILELIEARLQDIVAEKYPDLCLDVVHVYDPFTTKWDFYVLLDVSWNRYEEIYGEYFNPAKKIGEREGIVRERYKDKDEAFRRVVLGIEQEKIFNATDSKTEIYKTIDEMYDLYPHLTNPRKARQ